ncbi:MAG: phosphate ABC transporter substrate-binding protein [Candidatus Caenarcaniphilales bacterium]|nr:phosphate ABC transporter substrate-binding protein [Candidatus Caenarcaniphilales bacterium]
MSKAPFYFFATFSVLGALFALSACNSEKASLSKITISGSTTVLPISESWAALYKEKSGVLVNVQGGGSTNGINQVRSAQVDIGASSRELSPEEKIGLRLIKIGKDVLVVVVNNKNRINNISSDKLKDIFAGKITTWKSLGGPDRTIQVINREPGSGTRKTFEELVMCDTAGKNCVDISLSSIVLNSNSEVKRNVSIIEDSIGYVSHSFLDESVKGLSLDKIEPSDENINSDKYPLSRSLYYLVREDLKSKPVEDYLDFIKTESAQEILIQEGYFRVLKN